MPKPLWSETLQDHYILVPDEHDLTLDPNGTYQGYAVYTETFLAWLVEGRRLGMIDKEAMVQIHREKKGEVHELG